MEEQTANVSRRAFLNAGAGAAVTAAGLATPGLADAAKHRKHKAKKHKHKAARCATGAPTPAAAPPGGRIDVHAHHIPPVYRVALLEHGQVTIGGYPTPVWTPERAIGFMDNYGIGTQVLSLSDPGVSFVSGSEAATLARAVNEYTATVIKQYPGRFGGLAVLPMPDVNASLTELAYALDTLKLDGVGLLSSYDGNTTAGPEFEPLWAEINRRKAFVFIHPTTLPANMKPPSVLPDFLVEFTFETTRFVASALNLGLLKTFPDLRIQLAHAGGCYPFLAYRVAVLMSGGGEFNDVLPPATVNGVVPVGATQGLYYDTAINPAPSAMRSVLEITDVEHVVFGSDWPFTEALFLRSGDPQPDLSLTFPPQQRHAVERGNALSLLPTLANRLNAA